MKSMLRTLLVAATATLVAGSAIAQTKTAPPSVPKNAKPANTAKVAQAGKGTTAAKPAAAAGEKFWGGVTKDPVKDGMFKFGSADPKRKGTFTVDSKGAKVTDKSGKFASLKNLTAGSSVTVMGTLKGTTIKATSIQITYLRTDAKGGAGVKAVSKADEAKGTTKPTKAKPPTKGGGTTKP